MAGLGISSFVIIAYLGDLFNLNFLQNPIGILAVIAVLMPVIIYFLYRLDVL